MPDLDKLEQFNQELIKSGNEPAIAEQRGEEIERVMTPAEYPLDHGTPKVRTAPAGAANAPAAVAPAKNETDDFLSQLAGDLDAEPEPETPAPASGGLDDLFELDSDILSSIPTNLPDAPEPPDDEPADGGDPFADLFGSSGGDDAAEAPAAPSPDAADLDMAGLSDFGDFDFGSESDAEEPAEVPSAPAPAFDDLGDFGDFGNLSDFADDAGAPPAPPAEADDVPDAEAPVDGDFGVPDFGAGAIPDFATDLGADFGTEDFADEFNMGDFGKDFGVMEEVAETPAAAAEAKHSVMEEVDEVIAKANAADEADAFDLSPADFKRVQECLAAMPLNLKIAVEEAVSDPKYTFDVIEPIIAAMVRGDAPKDIAGLLARATGKRIKIPAGYTRRTGLAFEAEQRSFAYQFRENFLPVLRTVLLVAVGAGLLVYGVWQFVVQPLYAASLYDQGLAAIKAEEYAQGNQLFAKAYAVWPDNDRYLQYAKAFRDRQQWALARAKYEQLLGMPEPRRQPIAKDRLHRQGILDFADFAAYTLRDYNSAAGYLQRLLAIKRDDHVPAVMQGDVFLEWARYTGDADRVPADAEVRRLILSSWPVKSDPEEQVLTGPAGLYAAARYDYAVLLEKEGQTDALLSRMLRYFLRLGAWNEQKAEQYAEAARKAREIGDYVAQGEAEAALSLHNRRAAELEVEADKIKKVFLSDAKSKPEPDVAAELAGRLIDRAEGRTDLLEEPFTLLMRTNHAGEEGAREAGVHYQLARYYRLMGNREREVQTLGWARRLLEETREHRPLDRFETLELIDTLVSQGEIDWGPRYAGKDPVAAQVKFEEARQLYETALRARIIRERSSLPGRVYARLGDLKYYQTSDWEGAMRQYRLARQSQYGLNPEELHLAEPRLTLEELSAAAQDISYKSGFIWYTLGNRLPPGDPGQASYFNEASREFLASQGPVPRGNDNLDWALATTAFLRGSYDTSASVYRSLAERVEAQRRVMNPDIAEVDFAQRPLVEFLIRIHNNLGASLRHLAWQGGRAGAAYEAQARYHLSRATELYQLISASPELDAFSDAELLTRKFGLPYLNLRAIVDAPGSHGIEVFRDLRLDQSAADFGLPLTEGGPGR